MASTANTGRTPKPPALRLLSGRGEDKHGNALDAAGRPLPSPPAFKRQPPDKPADMSPDASEMWDLIVSGMNDVDLLKPLDAGALEVACETFARWKDAAMMRRTQGMLAETSQGTGVAPWVRVEEAASKEWRAWCAEFGLTPAAENKVGSFKGGEDDANPFD